MAFTIRPNISQQKMLIRLKELTNEPTLSGSLLEAGRIVVDDLPGIRQQLSSVTAERNKLYNAITDICNNYKLSVEAENKVHKLIIDISKEISKI